MKSYLYNIGKSKGPSFDFLKISFAIQRCTFGKLWQANCYLRDKMCYKMNIALIEAENVCDTVFSLI